MNGRDRREGHVRSMTARAGTAAIAKEGWMRRSSRYWMVINETVAGALERYSVSIRLIGSSVKFIERFKSAGIEVQAEKLRVIRVTRPVNVMKSALPFPVSCASLNTFIS